MSHAHHHGPAGNNLRRLAIALGLTGVAVVLQVVGGIAFDSLALLADAGHMLSDAAALGLALGATWLARRPAGVGQTFGYRRVEILAALANGVSLVAIAIWVAIEAVRRLDDPPDVAAAGVLAVAIIGLLVNLVSARLLWGGRKNSLNVAAAARHVMADALGSVGVIVAAGIVLVTGWRAADPLVSLLIAGLILVSSWSILAESVRVLMEASPPDIDVAALGRAIAAHPGVREVHDLHVWTITSGFPALSAHILVARDERCHDRRRQIAAMIRHDYGIEHITLQVEHAGDGSFVPVAGLGPHSGPR